MSMNLLWNLTSMKHCKIRTFPGSTHCCTHRPTKISSTLSVINKHIVNQYLQNKFEEKCETPFRKMGKKYKKQPQLTPAMHAFPSQVYQHCSQDANSELSPSPAPTCWGESHEESPRLTWLAWVQVPGLCMLLLVPSPSPSSSTNPYPQSPKSCQLWWTVKTGSPLWRAA